MAAEAPIPVPVPEAKTWLGRQLWDIRGVLMGPPGQRAYDKKRLTLLVVLLAVVQLGAQGAGKVIALQFETINKLFAAQVSEAKATREEAVQARKENTAAIRFLACELRDQNIRERVARYHERLPPREECK